MLAEVRDGEESYDSSLQIWSRAATRFRHRGPDEVSEFAYLVLSQIQAFGNHGELALFIGPRSDGGEFPKGVSDNHGQHLDDASEFLWGQICSIFQTQIGGAGPHAECALDRAMNSPLGDNFNNFCLKQRIQMSVERAQWDVPENFDKVPRGQGSVTECDNDSSTYDVENGMCSAYGLLHSSYSHICKYLY